MSVTSIDSASGDEVAGLLKFRLPAVAMLDGRGWVWLCENRFRRSGCSLRTTTFFPRLLFDEGTELLATLRLTLVEDMIRPVLTVFAPRSVLLVYNKAKTYLFVMGEASGGIVWDAMVVMGGSPTKMSEERIASSVSLTLYVLKVSRFQGGIDTNKAPTCLDASCIYGGVLGQNVEDGDAGKRRIEANNRNSAMEDGLDMVRVFSFTRKHGNSSGVF